MTKTDVFRALVESNNKRNNYIDSVPRDIQSVVFDNGYVDTILRDNTMLIDAYFGEYAQSVSWFLYEWQPGFEVGMNGETEAIYNFEQYIDWMRRMEGWDD